MYAKLKGVVIDIFSDFLIIEVSNVGYRVETIKNDFLVGQKIELYIYTHVRETEIRLFGMDNRNQYMLFVDLISISGVGPKVALTILSQLSYESILSAIESQNIDLLKVKGVGKKTAQRIVIDMSSKLEKYNWVNDQQGVVYNEEFNLQSKEALRDLGFSYNEISSIIKEYTKQQQPQELEIIIKFALKYIKKK